MDDYKLLGKDEVREIMGGCSDQMAYRVIRELNSELREKGIARDPGRFAGPTGYAAHPRSMRYCLMVFHPSDFFSFPLRYHSM